MFVAGGGITFPFLPAAEQPGCCILCQQRHLVNRNRVQFFPALGLGQYVADEMGVGVPGIR